MKSQIIIFCIILTTNILFGQIPNDSLNRFDSKKQKNGYWIAYVDSSFNLTEKNNAKYYGYEYFTNGKLGIERFSKSKWKVNCKKVYKPYNKDQNMNYPILLNGEVFYYDELDSLYEYESYKNGMPSVFKEILYNTKSPGKNILEIYYFDSLYNNNPNTLLFYKIDYGMPIYKQYQSRFKKIESDKMFFVKHREFKSINKLRLGYTYQNKSFLEVGFSKKYNKGYYIDTTQSSHFDEIGFHGFSISLLGSADKHNFYFGQKIIYSYTLALLNSEIGFVNYSNFKNNDYRVTIGAGITAYGRVSIMYHYTIPLSNMPFENISKNSISLTLF